MNFLIDSNILIYSYLDGYQHLRSIILDELSAISEISKVEVLGYHKLTDGENRYFSDLLSFTIIVHPSTEILEKATEIRRKYNMKLGDSIIAATALIHNLILYTRNISDFDKITELSCVDPLK